MKRKNIFLCIIILLIIIIIYFCIKEKENKLIMDKISYNNVSLLNNIKELKGDSTMTRLQDITDFEWDKVYQFLPYTSPKDIVGYMRGVDFYTASEGTNETNILFVKDNEPVCYIFGTDYDLKVHINLWDFSDERNYVAYDNDDINTLIVDYSSKDCVSLFLPYERNIELHQDLFNKINKNDIIGSRPVE